MRMVLDVVLAFLLCSSLDYVLMVPCKYGVHVSRCDVLYLRLLLAHFNAAFTTWLYAMIISEKFPQGSENILPELGCPALVRATLCSVPLPRAENKILRQIILSHLLKIRLWNVPTPAQLRSYWIDLLIVIFPRFFFFKLNVFIWSKNAFVAAFCEYVIVCSVHIIPNSGF